MISLPPSSSGGTQVRSARSLKTSVTSRGPPGRDGGPGGRVGILNIIITRDLIL